MFLQNTLIAFAHRNLKQNTVQYMRLFYHLDGDPTSTVECIRRYAAEILEFESKVSSQRPARMVKSQGKNT